MICPVAIVDDLPGMHVLLVRPFESAGIRFQAYPGGERLLADLDDARVDCLVNQKIEACQEIEVAKVSGVLSAVANGDLTQHYDVAKADEDTADVFGTFSQIAAAVNSMSKNLHDVFKNLTRNAGQLASTSTELSATATQLASGAEKTSAQSTTVAAAAEEMSTNMKNITGVNAASRQTAQGASQTEALATELSKISEQLREVVGHFHLAN